MIRVITAADIRAISALCLATAAMGEDAAPLHTDPDLPGLVWAVPYAPGRPPPASSRKSDGMPAGFIVACPDTRAFEAALEVKLVAQTLPRIFSRTQGHAGRPRPHRPHPRAAHRSTPDIVATHPAHLHINLLPQARGRGIGTALLNACLASLDSGAIHAAIHIENDAAHRFFTAAGFIPIGPPRGVARYLGKTLPNSR